MADGFLPEPLPPCKSCNGCGETKPLTEFYVDKRDGRPYGKCRSCVCKRTAVYQQTHTDKVAVWGKKSRDKYPGRIKARGKRYRKHNAEQVRERAKAHMRRQKLKKMGITEQELFASFDAQGGLCAICNVVEMTLSGGRETHLDHCHRTMKFRGILCLKCNTALGKFGDSPERLERAAAYLRGQLHKVSNAKTKKEDAARASQRSPAVHAAR